MVTYQQLHTLVLLNLSIVFILFIIGKIWKKASELMLFLISINWLACSWYYQLRLANHLPPDLHTNHLFLEWFLTIVFGFGCYLSILAVFIFGSIAIGSFLHSDRIPKKGSPNHSPLPLWIAAICVGLLSAWVLRTNKVPQLDQLMNRLIQLIYVKLLQSKAEFDASYILVAGIAAGTIVTICFSKLYRNSKVPFIYFLPIVLVPVLTAALAPLVELLGCILVIVLAIAAIYEKDESSTDKRHAWLYFLLALGIGVLSGFYFYTNDLAVFSDNKVLSLVGGVASGFTIACLGFKSFSDAGSPVPALCILGFIPYCTPAFGAAVAFIINMIAAIVLVIVGLKGERIEEPEEETPVNPWDPNAFMIQSETESFITFNDHGRAIIATAIPAFEDTYVDNYGRMFQKQGDYAMLVK